MNRNIKIGTRGSKLALWQAHKVQSELKSHGFKSTLQIIKTQGDNIQNIGFDKMEGKGFFTKEIEEALLNKDIDVAVHSLKDLPTTPPEGLVLAGLSARANPSDMLIIQPAALAKDQIFQLPTAARIGTSSIRRKAQILHFRPDVLVQDLRGNVPTRVNKLQEGHYDAIILASAGVDRLEMDLSEFKVIRMHPREYVPAPAQGVIAYQVRGGDIEMRKIISLIHDPATALTTIMERTVLKMMDGGCQVPIGVYCEMDGVGNYHLHGAYLPEGGTELIRHKISQSTKLGLAEAMVAALTDNEKNEL